MRALVHLVFGEKIPDCTKCEGEPRLRVEYGCDREEPCPCGGEFERCRTCLGTGKRVVFTVSDGNGEKPMHRCPGKLTEKRPDVRSAFWACRQYEDHGLLPAAGGLSDQTPGFLEYLRIYQHEHSLLEKARAEQAAREAARAAKARR